MNDKQKKQVQLYIKQLDAHKDSITEINSSLETIAGELREQFDALGEAAQESEKGESLQATGEAIEEACLALDNVYTEMADALSKLEDFEL